MSRSRAALYDLYLVAGNALLALPGHAFRRAVLRHVIRAQVAAGCSIERGVRITTKGWLTIGAGTNINSGVVLDARGGLSIGERVNISPEVMMLSAEHDPGSPTFDGRDRPVRVEDRSWIATRAVILPGAHIGTGAVVAAGAVVHGRVEPWTVVAGNPARVISTRSPDAQSSIPPYRRWFH